MQPCSCSESENFACHICTDIGSRYSSDSSNEEIFSAPHKEKVLMVATEEEEIKILSHIHGMEEGEMNNRLTEAFMEQLHFSSSKNSAKKPLFVDASFEQNTRSFQVHSLTLGEVSREIHSIKT